jgi:hypothetical protein
VLGVVLMAAQVQAQDITDLLDKLMTAGEAASLITAAPVQVTGMRRTLRDWIYSGAITVDYAGVLHWNIDVTGKLLTTETSSSGIATYTQDADRRIKVSTPLCSSAAGTDISSSSGDPCWFPIPIITVTAGGTGAPPDTEIIPAQAGAKIDVMIWVTPKDAISATTPKMRFYSDTATAKSNLLPPYDGKWVGAQQYWTYPGHIYGMRMQTTVNNKNFGIANGAAGDWANNGVCTFSGFYRYIA